MVMNRASGPLAYKALGLRGGQVVWCMLRFAGARPVCVLVRSWARRQPSGGVRSPRFVLPNKRLQLTAAVGGVPRRLPPATGSGVSRAGGRRLVVRWCARGCS